MHAILEIRNLTQQERAVMDALLLRSPDPVGVIGDRSAPPWIRCHASRVLRE